MVDGLTSNPDDDFLANQGKLEQWLRSFGYSHGEDWNRGALHGYDPTVDPSFRPDRVAIEILFALMPPLSDPGEMEGFSHGTIKLFKDRIHEAETVDENIARIVNPALVDASILQRRRLAGEANPKPRVRISATRTSRGNFSVRIDPFVTEPDGRPDLLDRPKAEAPGDWFPGRDWQQVVFLRRFDEFARVYVPYRTLVENKLAAATAMFAVHLFSYVGAMTSKQFEVTLGDVPCLDYRGSDPPRLKLVPHAISAAWRRLAEEEYGWRGLHDSDDAAYGIDDMPADARTILDVISGTEIGDAGDIATIDLLRRNGVRATRRNLRDCIGHLRKAAEQPARSKSAKPRVDSELVDQAGRSKPPRIELDTDAPGQTAGAPAADREGGQRRKPTELELLHAMDLPDDAVMIEATIAAADAKGVPIREQVAILRGLGIHATNGTFADTITWLRQALDARIPDWREMKVEPMGLSEAAARSLSRSSDKAETPNFDATVGLINLHRIERGLEPIPTGRIPRTDQHLRRLAKASGYTLPGRK